MIKKNLPYIVFALLMVAMFLVELSKPKPINWEPSFSKNDKIPYGNNILYDLLPDLFPDSDIKVKNQTLYGELKYEDYENTNYIFINESFELTELDATYILDYVEAGNHVFIAANSISIEYEHDSLVANMEALYKWDDIENKEDLDEEILDIWQPDTMSYKGMNFVNDSLYDAIGYNYNKKSRAIRFFYDLDSLHSTQVLGVTKHRLPNFIKVEFGEGAFYLNANPIAFTNYYMLIDGHADYVSKALSHLPNQTTYWDEYYKIGRQESKTMLRYIVSNQALKWLLILSLVSLLLFMIFEAKRKQRVIPVVEPPKNSSLEFVETISGLYLQQNDHKNLADKKIKHFYDFIRNKLYLKDIKMTEEFFEQLSIKSGIELEEVKKVFLIINNIQNKKTIFDTELITLSEKIDFFYEKIGVV